MTDRELQDIEKLLDETTPGKWVKDWTYYDGEAIYAVHVDNSEEGFADFTNKADLALFMAAPELVADLRRLRAVLDAARRHAERGNWNGCKAALFETGGDA
jgi:hypothetical protein